jgi:hypothetical protein
VASTIQGGENVQNELQLTDTKMTTKIITTTPPRKLEALKSKGSVR